MSVQNILKNKMPAELLLIIFVLLCFIEMFQTALKTLIVIHRIIRETDAAAFMEEVLRVGEGVSRGRGGRVLAVDNFLDTANVDGRFDFSEWVRAYGKYLDEQLEVFSAVAWHVDLESNDKESRMKSLSPNELLQQLPYLQRLQRRLVDCVPRGQATRDDVVLLSLSMVVRESFRLYKAISEGLINLADTFFSMQYLEACRGLETYREAISGGEALVAYYAALQQVDAVRNVMEMPHLDAPPSDFLESMEAYVKTEAPRKQEGAGEDVSMREGGVASASSGAGAVSRKIGPLRKGRLAQPTTGRQTSFGLEASAQKDLGMLLSPGAVTNHDVPSTGSPPRNEKEEEGERGFGVASQDALGTREPAAPIIDLLGFDDKTTPPEEEEQQQQRQQVPQQQPSALDLLGELDFSSLSVGPETNRSAAASTPLPGEGTLYYQGFEQGGSSNAIIPDAFVMRAAADVYGRPQPGGGGAGLGTLAGAPPPPQQMQLQYGQHQYYYQTQHMEGYAPHQTPYGQQPQSPWGGPGVQPGVQPGALPSPQNAALMHLPTAASPWTTSAPTPVEHRHPEPFRQAGAPIDPFSTLTGLQQQQPSRAVNLRTSPGSSMTQGGEWK